LKNNQKLRGTLISIESIYRITGHKM